MSNKIKIRNFSATALFSVAPFECTVTLIKKYVICKNYGLDCFS